MIYLFNKTREADRKPLLLLNIPAADQKTALNKCNRILKMRKIKLL